MLLSKAMSHNLAEGKGVEPSPYLYDGNRFQVCLSAIARYLPLNLITCGSTLSVPTFHGHDSTTNCSAYLITKCLLYAHMVQRFASEKIYRRNKTLAGDVGFEPTISRVWKPLCCQLHQSPIKVSNASAQFTLFMALYRLSSLSGDMITPCRDYTSFKDELLSILMLYDSEQSTHHSL